MPAPGPKDGHASRASRDLGGRRGAHREIKNVGVKSNGFKGASGAGVARGRAPGRGRLVALDRGAAAIARAVPRGRGGEGGEDGADGGEKARARGREGDDGGRDDGGREGDDDDDDGRGEGGRRRRGGESERRARRGKRERLLL